MSGARFDIDHESLQRLERKLDSIGRWPLEHVALGAMRFLKEAIAHDAPRDTGATVRDLRVETRGLETRLVDPAAGAFRAEFGRHAGAAQPPVEAIRAWAGRRGIPEADAFAIARAIAKRGIKGRFFARRALEALRHYELPRLLERTAREIERRFADTQ